MSKEKSVESDLGIKSEISVVIGSLVNLEEHLEATIKYNKKYIPILEEVRKTRVKYMKEFIGDKKLTAQEWCQLKHILGIAYRQTEVATKNISLGNEEKAIDNLSDSEDYYKLAFVIISKDDKNGNDGKPKEEDKQHQLG